MSKINGQQQNWIEETSQVRDSLACVCTHCTHTHHIALTSDRQLIDSKQLQFIKLVKCAHK